MVSVDARALSQGTYTGVVSLTSVDATNSPVDVTACLTVAPVTSNASPFGAFSTPASGSTVHGAVAFTGWALDDVEVDSVKIWLDPGGGPLMYVGDADFAEGNRPDIEAAYPDLPLNYRAGWVYTLLSHFLPGGDGTFVFSVQATDTEGQTATLGTSTVTADNASAVKPFGMMDSPAVGSTVSGRSLSVQGWVLTPQPNMIPTNGSTLTLWVDGAPVGNPTYNIYREDVATLFPGYANSSGAGWMTELNTTRYSNGVHTITLVALDDAANVDGVGSRNITILNTDAVARSWHIAEAHITATNDGQDYLLCRYRVVNDSVGDGRCDLGMLNIGAGSNGVYGVFDATGGCATDTNWQVTAGAQDTAFSGEGGGGRLPVPSGGGHGWFELRSRVMATGLLSFAADSVWAGPFGALYATGPKMTPPPSLSHSPLSNGTVQVSMTVSNPPGYYTWQRSTNLVHGEWEPLDTRLVTGPTDVWTEILSNAPAAFLRTLLD